MTTRHLTPEQIRRAGFEALVDALGPADALRFVRQFEPGRGNYTEERHQWLDGLTLNDIMRDIEHRRAERAGDEEPSED